MDVLHRLGRQAAASVEAAGSQQRAVEPGQMGWGQPLQLDLAERRDDVPF